MSEIQKYPKKIHLLMPGFCPDAFKLMFKGIICFMLLSCLPVNAQGQLAEYRYSKMFSVADCKEDLNYYRNKLETEHPDLYIYLSSLEFKQFFDSITGSITMPMNSINFYNLITLVLPKIKDGHTHIFPDPATTEDNDNLAPFFPVNIHWEDGHMYVVKVYSSDKRLTPGTEIQIINGVNASFLYDLMIRRQIRDGYNLTYPAWILERYFAEYYSYHIGNPDSFTLNTRRPDNTYETITINGLTKDSIAYYRKSLYNEPSGDELFNTGITLSVDTSLHAAVLTIKDFHNDHLHDTYRQNFKQVISALFTKINEQPIEHLILDLRNNQGGDIENGVMLLSYLLDTTFQAVQSYSKVDPKTYQIPMARLKPVTGPMMGPQEPQKNNFKGKLYVLTNGGSFSNSAIVCSALQAYHRCAFIGEETGGNPNVIAGGGKYTTLPKTRTQILVPNLQFEIRLKAQNPGTGIQPDHLVKPTLQDILAGRDPILNYTYQLIRENKS